MRIEVLGGYGGESLECRLTCLRINDRIALDAGSLAQTLPVEEQRRVRSVILTHSHMDHTNSLPFFIDNIYDLGASRVDVYASAATIYAVRRHLFNNTFWPDFARLPNHLLPAVGFHELQDEVPVEVEGVSFTPIPVHHSVPTYGFLIEERGSAVLWSSDTGPTVRLWEIANQTYNLKSVFVETSFSNALQEVADDSQHLTPRSLVSELRKLERPVPIVLHHLKPACIDDVQREIGQLRRPDISFIEQGRIYEF